eukprot:520637_1
MLGLTFTIFIINKKTKKQILVIHIGDSQIFGQKKSGENSLCTFVLQNMGNCAGGREWEVVLTPEASTAMGKYCKEKTTLDKKFRFYEIYTLKYAHDTLGDLAHRQYNDMYVHDEYEKANYRHEDGYINKQNGFSYIDYNSSIIVISLIIILCCLYGLGCLCFNICISGVSFWIGRELAKANINKDINDAQNVCI